MPCGSCGNRGGATLYDVTTKDGTVHKGVNLSTAKVLVMRKGGDYVKAPAKR